MHLEADRRDRADTKMMRRDEDTEKSEYSGVAHTQHTHTQLRRQLPVYYIL